MWDDWSAIEAAQQKADAADAQRRADAEARREARKAGPPTDATPAPVADPEALAAVEEASRVVWPHPIPPTTFNGPQPTNADGSRRDGYWRGGVWEDRPKREPVSPVEAVRWYLRVVADSVRKHLEEEERPPWER